jgi:GntR family transcriptional regulator/MocR family aminotransferase
VDLFLSRGNGKPLAERLYEQLRLAIASGRLRPGDKLTPSRQLAGQLGISRHTVTTAYERLVAEGYVEGRAGGGSVVAAVKAPPPESARRAAVLRPARRFDGWVPFDLAPRSGYRFDLRPGLPDPALFPAAEWRRRLAAAVTADSLHPGSPFGDARLRQAIAAWVARSRSVAADKETIVVTSGIQHAVDLVGRVLLEPGDCVAVEDPGYLPVVRLFRAMGACVVGVPVDDEGLVVELLPASARIVYVTPSHQFPLGMAMSASRRSALLEWAADHDAAILEDDYDTELHFGNQPLEPIQRLDEHGRVIYLGSFSKTFFPSLRLGFAVVPEPLAEAVAALRQLIDWHPPAVTQAALAGFIADGLLEKHIRRCRLVYAERRRILAGALSGPLACHLRSQVPSGGAGLHIAATLRGGLNEQEILRALAEQGIGVLGLSRCYQARPGRPGLLLGFGAVSAADLPQALRVLAGILASRTR